MFRQFRSVLAACRLPGPVLRTSCIAWRARRLRPVYYLRHPNSNRRLLVLGFAIGLERNLRGRQRRVERTRRALPPLTRQCACGGAPPPARRHRQRRRRAAVQCVLVVEQISPGLRWSEWLIPRALAPAACPRSAAEG
jgi:hypothetical protein